MVSIDHFRDENMSGSDAPSLYRQQYLEAVQHFKDGKLENCASTAKYNLTDASLPRFYQMKNMLLVAAAEGDWYEGVRWRMKAEKLWSATKDMVGENNQKEQMALQQIRDSIDYRQKQQDASAPSEVDESRLVESDTEEGESEDIVEQRKADQRAAQMEATYGGPDFVTRATQLEKMPTWKATTKNLNKYEKGRGGG